MESLLFFYSVISAIFIHKLDITRKKYVLWFENFLSCNSTKHYWNWSTFDRVITKIKRMNLFLRNRFRVSFKSKLNVCHLKAK